MFAFEFVKIENVEEIRFLEEIRISLDSKIFTDLKYAQYTLRNIN